MFQPISNPAGMSSSNTDPCSNGAVDQSEDNDGTDPRFGAQLSSLEAIAQPMLKLIRMSQIIGETGQQDYPASASASSSQSGKEQDDSDQDAGYSARHSARDHDHEHSRGSLSRQLSISQPRQTASESSSPSKAGSDPDSDPQRDPHTSSEINKIPSSHDPIQSSSRQSVNIVASTDPSANLPEMSSPLKLRNKASTDSNQKMILARKLKEIFNLPKDEKHDGENVRISIPLSAVETVEQCQSIQFAETIRIKTKQMSNINQPSIQSQSHKLSDDYFFGFIHNSKAPYESIQSTLATYVSSCKTTSLIHLTDLQACAKLEKNPDLKAQNDSSDVVPSTKKEDTIKDSTRNALLSTLTLMSPAQKIPDLAHSSNEGCGGQSDSSPKYPSTNDPTNRVLVTSLSSRIRKISSTGNKIVGSPIRSASSIVKVKTPLGNQSPASPHPHSDSLSKPPSPPPVDTIINTSRNFSSKDQEKLTIGSKSGSMLMQLSNSSPLESNLKESHTYPPNYRTQFSTFSQKEQSLNPTSNLPAATSSNLQSAENSWALIPGWLKSAPKLASLKPTAKLGSKGIIGSAKNLIHSFGESDATLEVSQDDDFNDDLKTIFGKHEARLTEKDEVKFKHEFNFSTHSNLSEPDHLELIFKTSCSLVRGTFNFYGRLYMSQPKSITKTNYKKSCICFKGTKKISNAVTKMILPISDIVEIELVSPTRFKIVTLQSDLITEPPEKLEFEFSSSDQASQIRELVSKLIEKVQSVDEEEDQKDNSLHGTESQLPIMFESTSSSFLTFKPKESLHITCLTIGSRGDVQPYIALCQALKKDGHTCRIASHGEYKPWIEGYGIEFVEIGGDPAELMKICVDNGMFTLAFIREGLSKFRGWLDDLLVSSYKACKGTDLLIESPSTMSGIHIAEALEIPYFRAFTMPWTRTREYPHAFAVPDHKMGSGYNYMTYTVFDQVFWRAISGQINKWRKQTLGLKSTSYEKLESHKVPFLYNFSQTIVPSPLDWFEWVHITGYWFLDEGRTSDDQDGEKKSAICSKEGVRDAENSVDGPIKEERKKWVPEPGLVQFIEKANNEGKKIVYIGFGSIVVPDPEEMTRIIVEAIGKADVYAIVTKGWSDRLKNTSKQPEKTAIDDRKNLETAVADVNGSKSNQKQLEIKDIAHNEEATTPNREAEMTNKSIEDGSVDVDETLKSCNIYNLNSVPHDWLFPRIHAACHHGGAGTTGASLRGDQYFWAERVETLGIGAGLRKMSVKNLSQALINATTDEVQIKKAKLVGEQIRSDLEYAKSLIKRRARTSSQMTGKNLNPSPVGSTMVMTTSDLSNSSSSLGKRPKLRPYQSNSYSTYSSGRGRSNSENLRSNSSPTQLVSNVSRSGSTGFLSSKTKPKMDRLLPTQRPVNSGEQPPSTAPALITTDAKSVTGQSSSRCCSDDNRMDGVQSINSSPLGLSPPRKITRDQIKLKNNEFQGGTKNFNSDEDSSSWDILSQSRSEPAELSGSFENLR
ncbi:hypothetical protein BY996DRAFT_6410683 [Phakopsora pachyrhizi]|nr:hypothetical protein BY996DRAFT_6410683 [Phakopsora pachyrhizi]